MVFVRVLDPRLFGRVQGCIFDVLVDYLLPFVGAPLVGGCTLRQLKCICRMSCRSYSVPAIVICRVCRTTWQFSLGEGHV